MIYTNKSNLPEAYVQAILNDPYSKEERGDISVTELIGPPQARILKKKFDDKIIRDVADDAWMVLGKGCHSVLEEAKVKSAIKEKRLFAEVNGWKTSGKFDHFALMPDGTLDDFKVTSVFAVKKGVKIEWEQQLNLLCFLCVANDHPPIKALRIIAFLRDWNSFMKLRDKNYPEMNIFVGDVKLWSFTEQEAYMAERVKVHQEAEKGNIPECTPEERWASHRTFKVIRGENKNPSPGGVFTDEFHKDPRKEAQDFIDDHKFGPEMRIEESPREFKRCEKYCDASPFCKQFQGE